MTRLIRFLNPYRWLLVLVLGFIALQTWANLELPNYTAKIVNQGIVQADTQFILHNGGFMLLVSLLGGLATIIVGFLAARIAAGVARDLRDAIFSRVESFSLAEFTTFSTASLITRTTNDVQQIQQTLFLLMRLVLAAPIMAIGAVWSAYHTAPHLSWVIGLAVVVLLTMIIVLFTIAVPKFQLVQSLIDRLNLVTRENLTGLRVIRAFVNEKYEQEKFERANRDVTQLNLFLNRLTATLQPMMLLVFNLTTIGIVWVGAHFVSAGSLQIGDMLAFMQYALQTIMAFLMVSIVFILVPRAAVSAKRIAEVITTEPSIRDPKRPKRAAGPGQVEFRDVSFQYPAADEPALAKVSFTAQSGQTTAIIGSTGSGKSTLISLIPRLYDATSGSVLIDGVDVRELKLDELYRRIGFVPQKGVLFSGTIKSNLTYGAPDASTKQLAAATTTAQAAEFIGALPERLDSPIAQGGQNVSGGQKQRLAIARAIVRDPDIYIFDDSFSAVDFATDARLRTALAKQTKHKTVIIVAQRISTIINADQIVVLDEGQVVGLGTHRELLSSCAVYREIALSQLSEEELTKHLGKPGQFLKEQV